MTAFSRATVPAILLAGLGAAGAAWAQDAMDGPRRGDLDFLAIDADADGSLTRAELTARATARLGAGDTNTDGALDRDELIAAMPVPRGGLGPIFTVDPAQVRADRVLAFMDATEAGRVEIVVFADRRVNELLARVDSDHDGAISREEGDAMADRHHDRRERGRDRREGDRD